VGFFPSMWHLLVKSQNGVPLFQLGFDAKFKNLSHLVMKKLSNTELSCKNSIIALENSFEWRGWGLIPIEKVLFGTSVNHLRELFLYHCWKITMMLSNIYFISLYIKVTVCTYVPSYVTFSHANCWTNLRQILYGPPPQLREGSLHMSEPTWPPNPLTLGYLKLHNLNRSLEKKI